MRAAAIAIVASGIFATPAGAAGEAAALWEHWQQRARAQGLTLDADAVAETGTGLEVAGLRIARDDASATLGALTLTETAAGAVRITLPDTVPLTLDLRSQDGTARRAVLTLTSRDLLVRQDDPARPDDLSFAAPDMTLRLDRTDGIALPADAALRVRLAGTEGAVRSTQGAPATLAAEVTSVTIDTAFTDPATAQRTTTESRHAALDLALDSLPGPTPADPATGARLYVETGPGRTVTETSGAETAPLRIVTRQDRSRVEMTTTADRARYDAVIDGVGLTISDPAIALGPLEMRIGAAALGADFPISDTGAAQPAELSLDLADLVLDERVWSALDPAGALPRNPLQLNAAFRAELAAPRAGLGAAAAMAPMVPESLRIDRFLLRYGKTSISAEGGMTFLPSATSGLPDPRHPVGTVTLDATGIQRLLQRLVAAGLVAPEQAMGVQMMIGMFAQTGEDDTLSTEIEGRPDGSLHVNGTRVR